MLSEKQRTSRRTRAAQGWVHQQSGYIFLAVVFLAFLRAGLHAATPAQERSAGSGHPIPQLMDAADARFRAKLARQSSSLLAAVAEYRRRHARAPPAGFDKWYAFAKDHGSGEELRRRAALVAALPSIDLVRIRDGAARTLNVEMGDEVDEVGSRAIGLKTMLAKFVHELPDMDFPINARSEGRVIVPWEHRLYPNLTEATDSSVDNLLDSATFSPDWAGTGSVWEAWRRTCTPQSPARRLYSSLGAGWVGAGRDRLRERWHENNGGGASASPGVGGELEFAEETNAGTDFCAAPGAHYEHGHFFSDWRLLPALVPVFSPARAPGFLDIRIPSHYYYGGTRRYTYAWDPINLEQRAVDAMEVPWEEKRDAVWWRGASTGGGSNPPGFGGGYQRHRFLRMASVGAVEESTALGRATAVTFAVPPQPRPVVSSVDSALLAPEGPRPGTYMTVPVPLPELNADVMDTAFVKEVVPVGTEHRMGDSVELGVGWGYKYLLDLDGMGYSGRFMAFLASDSVPVKATVYDEYFSGWLEPWVHYIPLSAAYAEIYNLVAYFSGPAPSVLRAANLSATGAQAFVPASGSLFSSAHRHLADRRRELGDAEGGGEVGGEADAEVMLRSAVQEEGDRRLRRIARAGKQWKRTMGRTIDMEVYVYRLALEYARLWADDREAMSYKP
ncbi:hypothetical protein B0H17DRAFT_1069507 [Mycena rosella]|uniref:Glycosyl transferase CAP10 domain-containing protein n=1 Tax=Mycena rosella TaxID=1033263 RepID=A0AAD7DBY9_MYCRO|nr:hypothetical protein B0H17DRAFT_1069507 [Mycena rosella]